MFGTVKIGEKEFEMVANAATPYRYNQIFHEDYMAQVTGKVETDPHDFFAKIGYVMAMQATKKTDLSKLNFETYMAWLEQFEPADVFSAVDEIADIYNGNNHTDVDPK